jgi:MFS family permease
MARPANCVKNTAANFGYLWAPSILLMIPCRVLHGIGWSGCSTAISTLAADIAPRDRRGELIGYAGMASSLAGFARAGGWFRDL